MSVSRRGADNFSRRALSRGASLFVSVSFDVQTDPLRVRVCCRTQYQAYSCYRTVRLHRALCLFVCLGIDLRFVFVATKCSSHFHTKAAPGGAVHGAQMVLSCAPFLYVTLQQCLFHDAVSALCEV